MENTPANSSSTKAGALHNSIPLAILLSALMVSGSILYVGGAKTSSLALAPQQQDDANGAATPAPIVDQAKLIAANNPVIGNPKAKVTIVEFSDFQCPFCRSFFEDTYGKLKKDYIDTGKVRLVFRDFPLPFHPAAKPAALAGQCANDQGKFWQFHDKIFNEQAKKGTGTVTFGAADLKSWAAQIGVDTGKFNSCLDSAQHDADVQADVKVGNDVGVSGTPSFFVNGKLLVGAQPYSAFKQLIDQELAK